MVAPCFTKKKKGLQNIHICVLTRQTNKSTKNQQQRANKKIEKLCKSYKGLKNGQVVFA